MLGDDRPNVTVSVGRSTMAERQRAWTEALEERNWSTACAEDIAERFYSIGGTTIERVLERAEAEAGHTEPRIETIWGACREAARPEFSGLAERVMPRYKWEDLILNDKVMHQLKHIESYPRNKKPYTAGCSKSARGDMG